MQQMGNNALTREKTCKVPEQATPSCILHSTDRFASQGRSEQGYSGASYSPVSTWVEATHLLTDCMLCDLFMFTYIYIYTDGCVCYSTQLHVYIYMYGWMCMLQYTT